MGPLTDAEYWIAGLCEAIWNGVQPEIVSDAFAVSETGREFDAAMTAAIRAAEWLDRAVETYRR